MKINLIKRNGNLIPYGLEDRERIDKFKDGAIYVIETSTLNDRPIKYDRAYIMPPERSIDIDTEKDFNDAEDIFSQL